MRLKLFDAIISPTLLFGLVALPMHGSNLEKLDVVQQKMLRKIVGWVRYSEEDWETTMRRMKCRVRSGLDQYNVAIWSERCSGMRKKYLARLQELPCSRWEVLATKWFLAEVADPFQEFHAHRLRGRPVLRWNDGM